MDVHDRLLAAYLAGDLDPDGARRWDAHLLECEDCWRAVREDRAGHLAAELLRQPAPPGLADRVAFAVEVAARQRPAPRHGRPGRARPGGRLGWRGLAGAGALAAGLAVTLLFLLLPGRATGSMPAAVAAVARYAQAAALPAGEQAGAPARPQEVGRPATLSAGGQRIVVRIWRLGGTEAVVAVSSRPFPMPAGARGASGGGMAWSARLGALGLYCVNGRTSELVAAPVPDAELAMLATRLPLA